MKVYCSMYRFQRRIQISGNGKVGTLVHLYKYFQHDMYGGPFVACSQSNKILMVCALTPLLYDACIAPYSTQLFPYKVAAASIRPAPLNSFGLVMTTSTGYFHSMNFAHPVLLSVKER